MLKNIRQLHLYLGTFFAPLIIFFALTGAAQTFGWHEGGGAIRSAISKLAEVHIHQRFGSPPRREEKPGDAGDQKPARAAAKQPEGEPPQGARPSILFKLLILLMSLGLTITTVLGIVMAFKYNRDRRVVWGLLIAGTILPMLLLAV